MANQIVTQVDLNRALAPIVAITPTVTTGTAAGFATGQFAQVDASTAFLVSSPSGGAARLRLRFVTKSANGAIDDDTLATISMTLNTSTITSVTAQSGGGTVIANQGLTTITAITKIRPEPATGVVDVIVVLAGAATITVTLEHRIYSSVSASLALATS